MEKVTHEKTIFKENLDHVQRKVDMILELFMGSMTTNFSYRVVIGEQIKNGLKAGKIHNATASNLPVYPQKQYPHKSPIKANKNRSRRKLAKGATIKGGYAPDLI